MIPKFKAGDTVSFVCVKETLIGTIYIVDRNGVFEDPNHVYYDILVEDPAPGCLYKHIIEDDVKLLNN